MKFRAFSTMNGSTPEEAGIKADPEEGGRSVD
jgi:hypothetical protein